MANNIFDLDQQDDGKNTKCTIIDSYDEDHEEDDCRMCRGPAEEGRPLHKPCECSGTIGFIHQDCLESWLKVKDSKKCELCGVEFRFAPKYAENAPETLPYVQVLYGLCHRAAVKWLPFLLRVLLAISLWFGALPLGTAYIYYGWLHWPSSIPSRWNWNLLASDTVSGGVISATIIVGFLFTMSMAEYFKFHWQQDGQADDQDDGEQEGEGAEEEDDDTVDPDEQWDDNFDYFSSIQRKGGDGEEDEEAVEDILARAQESIKERLRILDEKYGHLNNLTDNNADNNDNGDGVLRREVAQHAKYAGTSDRENLDLNTSLDRNVVGFMDEGQPIFRGQTSPGEDLADTSLWTKDYDGFDELNNNEIDAAINHVQKLNEPIALRRQRKRKLIQKLSFEDNDDEKKETTDLFPGHDETDENDENERPPLHNNLHPIFGRELLPNEKPDSSIDSDSERKEKLRLEEEAAMERMMRMQEEEEMMDIQMRENEDDEQNINNQNQNNNNNIQNPEQRDGGNDVQNERVPDPQPRANGNDANFAQDDEVHVAIDELIGLRGPISSSIRNLILLLTLNAIYLGMFAFVPHALGLSVYTRFSRFTSVTELMYLFGEMLLFLGFDKDNTSEESITNFKQVIDVFKAESERSNSLLRLSDTAMIILGYAAIAVTVYILHLLNAGYKKFEAFKAERNSASENRRRGQRDRRNGNDEPADIGPHGAWNGGEDLPIDIKALILEKLQQLLEATTAIVKVQIILFMRMFVLPIILGIWLNMSTLEIFQSNLRSRILFATEDFFAFMLLHIVIGITFMLLVTMSVLQLREVVHPDLLAQTIKPQEPQPDLLGNLLQDNFISHLRRMVIALGIYATSLCIHVWIPIKLSAVSGFSQHLPFAQMKQCFMVMPQLQVPAELLSFYLIMRVIVETYRNQIGETQHNWLLKMCNWMNIQHQILPHQVKKFELVGTFPLCKTRIRTTTEEFSFWKTLLSLKDEKCGVDQFIESNLKQNSDAKESNVHPIFTNGIEVDGVRKLDGSTKNFIRSNPSVRTKIPTKIGSYHLREQLYTDSREVEFWREVLGDAIPRPPENWDDLAAGGAEEQGRWAWNKENKSNVEKGVGQRKLFFPPTYRDGKSIKSWKTTDFWLLLVTLTLKLSILLLTSWLALLACMCVSITAPLKIGSFLFDILRIPKEIIHDPFIFAVGAMCSFPIIAKVTISFSSGLGKVMNRSILATLRHHLTILRFPSLKKFQVFSASCLLWFVISPLLLGMTYELLLIKPIHLWNDDNHALCFSLIWTTGFVLLHIWAGLCYIGFFRRKFWMALFGAEDDGANVEDTNSRDGWQGNEGVISRYTSILSAVFFGLEWDKVDRKVLLDECNLPVTCNILMAFMGPNCANLVWLLVIHAVPGVQDWSSINLPLFGPFNEHMFEIILYAFLILCFVSLQAMIVFRSQLKVWYAVAHKAARDDRYLIGEELLDYVPPSKGK